MPAEGAGQVRRRRSAVRHGLLAAVFSTGAGWAQTPPSGAPVGVVVETPTFSNGTLIEDDGVGVFADALDSFLNTGTVRGLGVPSNGVFIFDDLQAFENSGTITGASVGLAVGGALVSGTNSGLIEATDDASLTSAALSAGSLGDFVNTGALAGGAVGVEVLDGAIGSLTNEAGGVISARTVGVRGGGGDDRLINAGTISVPGGVAVDFLGGDDTLILRSGSVIDGAVLAGAGTDAVRLEGSGPAAVLDLSSFQDFENLFLETGAEWTVSGASPVQVTVANQATLSGDGQFAALTVAGGGAAAPGGDGAIGLVNVTGDVIFESGSFYDVDIAADGRHDRIQAGGGASIASGVTLRVTPLDLDADFVNGDSLAILTADGGVSGDFSAIASNSNLDFSTRNAGTTLFLDVAPFDPGAMDGNTNVASTADALFEAAAGIDTNDPNTTADQQDLVDIANTVAALPADDQTRAVETLSGQPHAEVVQAGVEAIQQSVASEAGLSAAVGGEIAVGLSGIPVSLSAGPIFTFGGEDDGDLPGYEVSNLGFGGNIGFDLTEKLKAAVRLGYSRFEARSTVGLGETTSNNVTVGLISTYNNGVWSVRSAFSYTRLLGLESRRVIEIGDDLREATANYGAFALNGRVAVGRRFQEKGFLFGGRPAPFGFVDWARFDRDGFTEDGAEGANLTVEADSLDNVLLGAGVNTTWRFEGQRMVFGPGLLLGVSSQVLDEQFDSNNQFSASAVNDTGDFLTDAPDRRDVFGRAGVSFNVIPKFLPGGLSLLYEAQIDGEDVRHAVGFQFIQSF